MKISTQPITTTNRSAAEGVGQLKKGGSGIAQNMAIQRNPDAKGKKKK